MAEIKSRNFFDYLPSTYAWRSRITQLVLLFVNILMRFFAISPLWPPWPFLQFIYTCCWLTEIALIVYYAIHNNVIYNANSIGGTITKVLFIAQMLAHLTVILEASLKNDKRERLLEMRESVSLKLREQLKRPTDASLVLWHLAIKQLFILISLAVLLVVFTMVQVETLYWYALLSGTAIKFRIVEILSLIVVIDGDIVMLCKKIDEISTRNVQSLHGLTIVSSRQYYRKFIAEDDAQQLMKLKSVHNELNSIFRTLNDCFGWSLLVIMVVYFVDFVSNCYWLLLVLLRQYTDFSGFIQNACFLLSDIVMLTVLCWHCQKTCNNSRYIGCLIFKLVKPLGNKQYNDLVSEFSLQVLHQQFVITAKDFFELNLSLLGSMVASIVTYLVILIQFMLTERSSTQILDIEPFINSTLIVDNATETTK